jgi:hypothetical protein
MWSSENHVDRMPFWQHISNSFYYLVNLLLRNSVDVLKITPLSSVCGFNFGLISFYSFSSQYVLNTTLSLCLSFCVFFLIAVSFLSVVIFHFPSYRSIHILLTHYLQLTDFHETPYKGHATGIYSGAHSKLSGTMIYTWAFRCSLDSKP